jgi:penicillin G amidase
MRELAGAAGPIVVRDSPEGYPQIQAVNWSDAARGLGHCVTQDRPHQMDLLRRFAGGRLAEVRGPGAVPSDLASRRLGLPQVALRAWDRLPPWQQELAQAFSAGVATSWPAHLERWKPVDCVAVVQFLHRELGSVGEDVRMVEVLRRTLPPEVVDLLLCTEDAEEVGLDGEPVPVRPATVPLAQLSELFARPPVAPGRMVVTDTRPAGSNAWAVSDGQNAVLANDMHLALTDPSLWYAATLEVGSHRVTGVTLPGAPLLIGGRNTRLAWGFTRLVADQTDLHELPADMREVPPERSPGPGEYCLRRETVRVVGANPVRAEFRDTALGPVIGSLAGRELAYGGALTEPAVLDFGAAELYEAATVDDGVRIVTRCGLPPVNVLLADHRGGIAWTVGGRFRRRAGGPHGLRTDGLAAAASDWLRPDELPRVIRSRGVLVNANNGMAEARNQGIGWNFFPGTRARRLGVLLSGDDPSGPTAVHVQRDTDAHFYEYYRRLARRHLTTRSARLAPLLAEVASWRGTADVDETGLALLVLFRECLREAVFSAATGPAQQYDVSFTYCHNAHETPLRAVLDTLGGELVPAPWRSAAHFVAGQLLTARALLTRRPGRPGPVRWGDVNRFEPLAWRHRSPADRAAVAALELPGCAESICVALPGFGASVRLVACLSGPSAIVLSIPGDRSERSPGWAAVEQWLTGGVGQRSASPMPSGEMV